MIKIISGTIIVICAVCLLALAIKSLIERLRQGKDKNTGTPTFKSIHTAETDSPKATVSMTDSSDSHAEDKTDCPYCGGTGRYECYSSLSGVGGSWEEPCPFCNKSGGDK
ncbi:hypothetical protein [Parasphaerochaeta coccoides]|uniref:Uncharacterized protein n=1 Tax=Parasphaerochaeta coccoides (strain ATCC BAA-1237 / DSM 17374 / SPN1) TaxID=760011 RepID=F4GIB8_PARC1|nr:hypothetical protein [Parasphaerochaeta coccoides]AEC01277.1 hypothetical protein Spico_0035 [Parasphaerochaeta coccoides DSM 17374]